MKNYIFPLLLFTGIVSYSNAQKVKLGIHVWMTKNLDVSTFRNGDPIPQAQTDEEWKRAGEAKQPAWCYFNNDPENGAKYGKLYNWYAVNDSRGIAPKGWHVASDGEWIALTYWLGGETVAGGKMKSTAGWNEPNMDASNNSGFLALPGGNRGYNSSFFGIGEWGYWWSSSEHSATLAWTHFLGYSKADVYKSNYGKDFGMAVRCVKD